MCKANIYFVTHYKYLRSCTYTMHIHTPTHRPPVAAPGVCGVWVGDDGVHTELLGPGGRVLAAEVVLVNLHRHVLLHL